MQSADAATPAPTYGTPASSSSPCTVPSSPNGPWRMGSTTSTSPSVSGTDPLTGTGSVSATLPSPSCNLLLAGSAQRPSRPISTCATSYRSASSASTTDRADASEISCSLERPPMSTATRIRSRLTGRLPADLVALVPADEDRHVGAGLDRGAARRILVGDEPVQARIVGVDTLRVSLEARVPELPLRGVLVLARHVRHGHGRRPRRDLQSHGRAARRRLAHARILADDDLGRLRRLDVLARHLEPGRLE